MTTKINDSTVIPAPAKPALVTAFDSGNLAANIGIQQNPKLSGEAKAQIQKDVNETTVVSSRTAIEYTGGFILIGFLISFLLPKKNMDHVEDEEKLAPVTA
jgi:hypothetical protein